MCKGSAVPWGLALILACVSISPHSSASAAGVQKWLKKEFKESRRQAQPQPKEKRSVARPSRNYATKPPSTPRAPIATDSFPQTVSAPPVRVALLIGNQGYDPSVGTLKNPHNDVTIVGASLLAQGFEVLPPIKDGSRGAMFRGVREIVRRLNAAAAGSIGFIYYSGHGAADKDSNINYLIPIDAREPGSPVFWDESIKLDDIIALLNSATDAVKFVVFDACRNELQLPTKDTTKGLVPVAEQQGISPMPVRLAGRLPIAARRVAPTPRPLPWSWAGRVWTISTSFKM